MEKTGELLESASGELREELECVDCGSQSAIYHTRDGNAILEEGAYSDRELSVKLGGEDNSIEWDGSLTHNSWASSHDRVADGNLKINGPEGEFNVVLNYRAMLDSDNNRMEAGKILETRHYYRSGDTEPFDDTTAELDVGVDDLESPKQFMQKCQEAAEADPQVEYEQRISELSGGEG